MRPETGPPARPKAPYRVVRDNNHSPRPWVALHLWYGNLYRPLGWFTTWSEAMYAVSLHRWQAHGYAKAEFPRRL